MFYVYAVSLRSHVNFNFLAGKLQASPFRIHSYVNAKMLTFHVDEEYTKTHWNIISNSISFHSQILRHELHT